MSPIWRHGQGSCPGLNQGANKRFSTPVGHGVIAYHMLKFGRPYQDLGDTYLDRLSHTRTKRNLVRHLEGLGYLGKKVNLTPIAA